MASSFATPFMPSDERQQMIMPYILKMIVTQKLFNSRTVALTVNAGRNCTTSLVTHHRIATMH